jgi:hypothetical protein
MPITVAVQILIKGGAAIVGGRVVGLQHSPKLNCALQTGGLRLLSAGE